jgi:NitT/TauT family transport system substrate-binding protein
MRGRRPRLCAALLLAASMTGACGNSAAAGPQKLTICMGPGAFFYVIHYIAVGGGFFKEEGLTTETIDVPSGPAQVAAIMGGSVDVGPLGLQLVVQAAAQGGDMVAISAGYNVYPITLVLSNDAIKRSGITGGMAIDEKVKRLHGLRLGITTPGSGTDDMARILFKTRGMDPDREVTIQPLGTTDSMLAALAQGVTDGFFYTSPIPELAVTRGLGQIVIEPLTGEVPEVKGVPYIILATSHATLEKKRNLMLAAVRAYTKAMQFVREKPEAARRITRPFFKAMDEAVFNAAFDKYAKGLPTDPVITRDQLAKTVAFMNLVKKSPVSANYDDVVYPDLGQEAAQEILDR